MTWVDDVGAHARPARLEFQGERGREGYEAHLRMPTRPDLEDDAFEHDF